MCSGHVTRVTGGSGDIIYDDQVRQYNGPHGGSIETTGHWPHTGAPCGPMSPSLPVQIQLCNRHKVATRRFITLFIYHCSMPRQLLAGADVTQWRPAIMPSHRRPSCPVRGDTAPTLSTSPPWSPWSLSTLSQLSPVQPEIDLLFVRRSLTRVVWESIPPYDEAATKTELHIDEELYRACSRSSG